jgi:hypothetical protein
MHDRNYGYGADRKVVALVPDAAMSFGKCFSNGPIPGALEQATGS